MDLSFHYFAVKTLARAAGFPEGEAQVIAEFSQYMDDNGERIVRRLADIPEYVREPRYDLVPDIFSDKFTPVQTGFPTNWDLIRLGLDLDQGQRLCCQAFHFPPGAKREAAFPAGSKAEKSPRAEAVLAGGGPVVRELMLQARDGLKNPAPGLSRRQLLMRIGMRLHTFADTYAHQLFSGIADPRNDAELSFARDNLTGRDVTGEHKTHIMEFTRRLSNYLPIIPAIGHMLLGHAPDLAHLSFSMTRAAPGGGRLIYSRSNTEEFLRVCRLTLGFLRDCAGGPPFPAFAWGELKTRLREAFLIDISKIGFEDGRRLSEELAAHWRGIFPEYWYFYDSSSIFPGAGEGAPDDYYRFNVFAEDQLIALYGEKPRARRF
ncbi:MAG: hypothetical protein LBU36_04455 [Clostridiales bacterium]|jgi:hypothetical protein|nr:hypothetical protein [Clostridiales bacterium]